MKTIKAVKIPFNYNINLGDCDGLDDIKEKLNKYNVELSETYIYCGQFTTNCCSLRVVRWCEPLMQWNSNKSLVSILTEEEYDTLHEAMTYDCQGAYHEIDENLYEVEELGSYTEARAKEIFQERKEVNLEYAVLLETQECSFGNYAF